MGMIPNVIKESARGWQTVRIDDVLLQKRAVFLTGGSQLTVPALC